MQVLYGIRETKVRRPDNALAHGSDRFNIYTRLHMKDNIDFMTPSLLAPRSNDCSVLIGESWQSAENAHSVTPAVKVRSFKKCRKFETAKITVNSNNLMKEVWPSITSQKFESAKISDTNGVNPRCKHFLNFKSLPLEGTHSVFPQRGGRVTYDRVPLTQRSFSIDHSSLWGLAKHRSGRRHPFIATSLNGNNGSWTNTDDHALQRRIMLALDRCVEYEGLPCYSIALDQLNRLELFEVQVEIILRRQHNKCIAVTLALKNRQDRYRDFILDLRTELYAGFPYFLIIFLMVTFKLSSSLNGNNGSWTNSDDTFADRVRKESKNHLHRKPVNKPRREDGDNHIAEQGQKKVNKQNAYARVNDLGFMPDTVIYNSEFCHVVRDDPLFVDSTHCYEDPVYTVLPPGIYNYYSKGYGWIERPIGPIDPKRHNRGYCHQAFSTYKVDEFYSIEAVLHKEQTWLLPTEIVEGLRKNLRTMDYNESTLKTICNRATTNMIGIPLSITESILNYFIVSTRFHLASMYHVTRGTSMRDKNPYAPLRDEYIESDLDFEYGAPFRINSVTCDVNPQYKVKAGITVNGKKLLDQPTLDEIFHGNKIARERWYMTGMCSIEGPMKFVTYDNNQENCRQALKRIIAARDNEQQLNHNQLHLGKHLYNLEPNSRLKEICGLHQGTILKHRDQTGDGIRRRVAEDLVNVVRDCNPHYLKQVGLQMYNTASWVYYTLWEAQLTLLTPFASREAAAEIANIKRKLRRCYVRNESEHTIDRLMLRRLEACVKRELAKPGKVGRLFVAYGAGCMYANELPEFVKMCLQKPIVKNVGCDTMIIRVFAKPKMKEINEFFQQAIKDQQDAVSGLHHVFIYSDDSVYMGRTSEGLSYAFNVDISSCDSSNGPAIFYLASLSCAGFDEQRAYGLVDMCTKPLYMDNPNDPEDRCEIVIDRPFEGSGTVLTTILNHYASLSIALSWFYQVVHHAFKIQSTDRSKLIELLTLSASHVGHLVTIEDTGLVFEKLQFLKYSPLLATDGLYYLTKNLGCILRSFGKVEGDMTHEQIGLSIMEFKNTPWNIRMDLFCSSVIQGQCHEPHCMILDALRDRFNVPINFKVESFSMVETYDLSNIVIQESSFGERYNLTPSEIHAFCFKIRSIKLGSVVVDWAAGQIFAADYGLKK